MHCKLNHKRKQLNRQRVTKSISVLQLIILASSFTTNKISSSQWKIAQWKNALYGSNFSIKNGYFLNNPRWIGWSGSSDPSHFIFGINIGKSWIRPENWVMKIQSRSISDSSLSETDLRNKMAWIWTTLKKWFSRKNGHEKSWSKNLLNWPFHKDFKITHQVFWKRFFMITSRHSRDSLRLLKALEILVNHGNLAKLRI